MNFKVYSSLIVVILTFTVGCSPKVVQETSTTTTVASPKVPVIQEPTTKCKTWINNPNQSMAMDYHVLYRDAIRKGRMDEAFPLWEEAYKIAPAADGKRDYHFTDGAKLYADKLARAKDEASKKEYIDKIGAMYEEAIECYPQNASKYYGLLAFDQYYKYGDFVSKETIYNNFKKSFDLRGDSAHYFTVNPYTAVMIDLLLQDKIPMSEAQHYAGQIIKSIRYGLENCKNRRECEPWEIVGDYAPLRLEDLEGIEGFYDCAYYKAKYMIEFEERKEDCETVQMVYGRLKWGGCPLDDLDFMDVKAKRDADCLPKVQVYTPGPLRTGFDCLQEGKYTCAVENFSKFVDITNDPLKKAKYALTIAKIYYAHLKKFSAARKWARQSAEYDPTNGEPYILIGKLYASSGPLCGPGRGWDSQIVTWPAIDKWRQAKRIDPNVAPEANRLISRYSIYMPSSEDIHQRILKEGAAFKVRCWIQENTTIRAARN
ncbi:MAG: hypothetical protein KJP00_04450 [Bacteroidia bacterium]|nr:hypothetical protein [Bacteroidia bacterium]